MCLMPDSAKEDPPASVEQQPEDDQDAAGPPEQLPDDVGRD